MLPEHWAKYLYLSKKMYEYDNAINLLEVKMKILNIQNNFFIIYKNY